MANSYVFPGGQTTFVPTLMQDLIIEYSRNPAAFPINKYINVRKVDKQRGYYVRMQNDNQGRFVNSQDAIWPDGNDAPAILYGQDSFTFPPFNCVRYGYSKKYGYLAVDQGSWDILDQGSRLLAMDAMTFRSRRVHTTLTTSGNWGSNSSTATILGGGVWGSATSVLPYIRRTIMQAAINIQLATYSSVQLKDLYLVINPNEAKVISTSQEFIDFLKQDPVAIQIWRGQEQFAKYNLPDMLFGVNVVVDDTVYNSAQVQETPVFSFSFPDNTAVLLSKQQAIQPSAGGSFSTYELFVFADMETNVTNDVFNRTYKLQVSENVDDTATALVSPQSGYLIQTNS